MKARLALLVVFAVGSAPFAACGSGDLVIGQVLDAAADGGPTPTVEGGARTDASVDAAADVDAGPPCSGKVAQPLDGTVSLTSSGPPRKAEVHVPSSYDPTRPTPVVLDFHDYTLTTSDEEAITALNAKADAVGFVSVHPAGTGDSWNGGTCCGQAVSSNIDDVGFVRALLDTLEGSLCVDPKRVFATGMGNGAFLAHRLACELADRIASVAPVAGPLGISTCVPSRPIAVLEIHGTADAAFPYGGNSALGYPAVLDVFAGWAKRDKCTGNPIETFRNIDAHCSTYGTCAGGVAVTQCTIENGGHTWPGSTAPTVGGYISPNLKATDIVWQFFGAHPMP